MPIMNILRYKSNDIALLTLSILIETKIFTLREFESQNITLLSKTTR